MFEFFDLNNVHIIKNKVYFNIAIGTIFFSGGISFVLFVVQIRKKYVEKSEEVFFLLLQAIILIKIILQTFTNSLMVDIFKSYILDIIHTLKEPPSQNEDGDGKRKKENKKKKDSPTESATTEDEGKY